jgi:hypothetical protein
VPRAEGGGILNHKIYRCPTCRQPSVRRIDFAGKISYICAESGCNFKQVREKRPRDTQRGALYKAEDAVFKLDTEPGRVRPQREFQPFVLTVYASLARPGAPDAKPGLPNLKVRVGHRQHGARAQSRKGVLSVSFSGHSASYAIACHELAHIANYVAGDLKAGHGPRFARAYLELVDRFLSPEWGDKLRQSFRLHRVRF